MTEATLGKFVLRLGAALMTAFCVLIVSLIFSTKQDYPLLLMMVPGGYLFSRYCVTGKLFYDTPKGPPGHTAGPTDGDIA